VLRYRDYILIIINDSSWSLFLERNLSTLRSLLSAIRQIFFSLSCVSCASCSRYHNHRLIHPSTLERAHTYISSHTLSVHIQSFHYKQRTNKGRGRRSWSNSALHLWFIHSSGYLAKVDGSWENKKQIPHPPRIRLDRNLKV